MRTLNFTLVVRILAILAGTVSLFLLVPGLLALIRGDWFTALAFFGPAGGALIVSGCVVGFVRPRSDWLGAREAYLMVTLGWLVVSIVGALPYFLSGHASGFADAFFESMSGFTTTGASIFTDVEALPDALLLWRSLTHWLGGMGVIALTVAILPMLGINGMQLMRAEMPGPDVDKMTPKLTHTAKLLWLAYVALTVAQMILLLVGGMSLFDAVNHSFSTMATGGFSTKNASLAYWDSSYIHWVCTVFMVLAGVNFALYFRLLTGKVGTILANTELKAYLIIWGSATIIAAVGTYGTVYDDPLVSLEHAAFQTASIISTTGFATADFSLWPAISQAALFLLMFVGGSTGSTAGGIKVLRIAALAKLSYHEFRYILHPRGVFALTINGRPVRKDLVYPLAGFVALYVAILLIGTIVVSSGGFDVLTSFTACLATLGNIGPGLGSVGPASNFSPFPDSLTWFFSAIMLLGRLELYTVLVLLLPVFWRR